MDRIIIEGAKPWDGAYDFDLGETIDSLTVREWSWIRQLADYLPANVRDGLLGADAQLIATLAVIALRRHGKIENRDVPDVFERLADTPYASIKLEFGPTPDEEDDAAGPPASSNAASSNGNTTSSGAATPASSASPAGEPPKPAGTPDSDTSESAPLWSAI